MANAAARSTRKVLATVTLALATLHILDGPDGPQIQSDLHDEGPVAFEGDDEYTDAVSVLERGVLLDFIAGKDVQSPRYRDSLNEQLRDILVRHP